MNMVAKAGNQVDQHTDFLVWVIACILLIWIIFIGFINQAG